MPALAAATAANTRTKRPPPPVWRGAPVCAARCQCPPTPPDLEEDNPFVSGPLKFLVDDPGRQRIGSFHPITEGDWSAGA